MKILLNFAWIVLALESIGLVCAAIFLLLNIGREPQERVTTLVFGVIAVLALLAVAAMLIYANKNQSTVAALAGLTVVLLPALVWAVQRASVKFDALDRAHGKAQSIQFEDAHLTAMSAAIERADPATLKKLLAVKPPAWKARNRAGQTLFGQALAHVMSDYSGVSGLEAVRLLAAAGARASVHDLGPDRLLMPSVLGANTPGAEQLLALVLEAGGDPNATDEQQEPLIHLLECTLPKLKVLVSHGADLRALSRRQDRRDWTALMTAVSMSDWDKSFYLLDQGVPPNHRNSTGETAATILRGVAQLKLDSGGKPDPQQPELMKRLGVR